MFEIVSYNEIGAVNGNTLLAVVITDGKQQVQVEGVEYVEDDAEELEAMFYEAVALAQAGEAGYTLL